ncbi:MAG: 2-C-methyl-D-erythritol 4-phosphate cytidylyltransferase [Deltaproteobacteria bacterium]|nr:2-C-methyl-D-erythritol 4-phosphate cytidylyltransferase [Deltaproteobacteria bacterium]
MNNTVIKNKTAVIIPAGGASLRFGGGQKKQFVTLNGRPVVNHSIAAFINHPAVTEIVVCLPKEDLDHPEIIHDKKIRRVEGGGTRSSSVHKGFSHLTNTDDNTVVLIHDAARPILSRCLIDAVIEATLKGGAAIPVTRLTDTIKEVDDHKTVIKTLNREHLRAVQTPQGFLYGILNKAYRFPAFDDPRYTDEALLVEETGQTVSVVDGERENIKITNQFDLKVAEAILSRTWGGLP